MVRVYFIKFYWVVISKGFLDVFRRKKDSHNNKKLWVLRGNLLKKTSPRFWKKAYDTPVDKIKKGRHFWKLIGNVPDGEDKKRAKIVIGKLDTETGKDSIKLFFENQKLII